jgi:hypothetical protein
MSNLTPDPETGLGTWGEDQIVVARREGQRGSVNDADRM